MTTLAVSESQIEEYVAAGWTVEKKLTTKTRIRKPKPFDEQLESKFWLLLFKLGYPEMNRGRKFRIDIRRRGAEALTKQVDVFAKDDETIVVAECKASERVTKNRSLQKDLEEFGNLKGPIAQMIREHFGPSFKPKIIWLFVTENIIWSKPDRERAAGQNIKVVTERELRYYLQIAEHLGKAARYQFLAEFLKAQEIPELRGKSVPALRGRLGGHKFYAFLSRPRDLLKIAFVNHRSLNDPEGAPTYQRIVSKARIREIGKFIANGGFFPTNLLVNFTKKVRFDKLSTDINSDTHFGTLYLPDRYRSAWVIDGQHRLYGYSPIDDTHLDDNIIVVAFEELQQVEEANLFVTINHEQKSVPKHLLDDLEGELKWGSEVPSERIGSIASRLINVLNADIGCPFYNRITQQGIPSTNKTCLTIPALKDAMRRSGLLGRTLHNNKTYEVGPLCGSTDLETLDKARSAFTAFFGLIREANLPHWEIGREGFVCTNVAVQAYTMLLGSLIKYWEANVATPATELSAEEIMSEIEHYMEPIIDVVKEASPARMEAEFKVPFGSGGPREYYFRLCRVIKQKVADFEPEGMEDWEKEQSEESVSEAGEFNVPIGSKKAVAYPPCYLEEVSKRLVGIQLRSGDFADVMNEAGVGDFVYVDPPYTVAHNNNGFIKYNQVLFSWNDQIRLANAATAAAKRGAKVFVSNANHLAVRKLFKGLPYHFMLGRTSVLAGRSSARRPTTESAFLSYRPGRQGLGS